VSPLDGAASVAWVGTWARAGGREIKHLSQPDHPLLARRQCDTSTSVAGSSAPSHCESVPAVLEIKYH
jgi:hypothetical protein